MQAKMKYISNEECERKWYDCEIELSLKKKEK